MRLRLPAMWWVWNTIGLIGSLVFFTAPYFAWRSLERGLGAAALSLFVRIVVATGIVLVARQGRMAVALREEQLAIGSESRPIPNLKEEGSQVREFSGPDYLLAAADKLKDQLPFGADIRDMVWQCFSTGETLLPTQAIARRPLTPQEQTPATIVGAAAHAAIQKKDWASLDEIIRVGLPLAVKFPEFLEMRTR